MLFLLFCLVLFLWLLFAGQDVNLLPDYDKVSFPPMRPLDPGVYLAVVPQSARDLILQLVCLNPLSRFTAAQV